MASKQEKIPVRFLYSSGPYNAGEVAGFTDDVVERFLSTKPGPLVARVYAHRVLKEYEGMKPGQTVMLTEYEAKRFMAEKAVEPLVPVAKPAAVEVKK
jgi:hypothetical protein